MKNRLNIGTRIAYFWENKQKTGTIDAVLHTGGFGVLSDDKENHCINEKEIIGVIV